MRKIWICAFVILCILIEMMVLFGNKLDIDVRWKDFVLSMLLVGVLIAFIGSAICDRKRGRTDGDLIAGVEDEDGLVFALTTPVEELVQKDIVIFQVVKEKKS